MLYAISHQCCLCGLISTVVVPPLNSVSEMYKQPTHTHTHTPPHHLAHLQHTHPDPHKHRHSHTHTHTHTQTVHQISISFKAVVHGTIRVDAGFTYTATHANERKLNKN